MSVFGPLGDEAGFQRGTLLYNVVYCSRVSEGVDAGAVDAIVAAARRNNPEHGITGLLFFRGGIFLQWLEGPRPSVLGLLKNIENDRRNYDLVVLGRSEEVRERIFGGWDMELVTTDEIREVMLDALSTVHEEQSARALRQMLQQLDQAPTVSKGSRVLEFSPIAFAPSGARAGLLRTRRGEVATPTFMPVATHAHVRNLTMAEVAESGAKICLANTYHLLLRPGTEVFSRVGGIHPFMKWEGSVLTDSGGYQIFSLPGERQIDETGARFRSPFDNQTHLLSPESSMATQQAINSDIMMVLDVCVPSTSNEDVTRDAMHRTHRWALRSLAEWKKSDTGQAAFAIVQGGVFPHLRSESAEFLTEHPFDGFAIGGLAVGEARELLYSTTAHTARLLPANKPRYLMGVGTPIDLLEAVNVGVDMFDCILPGKMAQQGYAFTFDGTVRLVRAEYRHSEEPIDATCLCPVCRTYSRGYLRHLSHASHTLSARLLTVHNLWFYQALMRRMREALVSGRWEAEYKALHARLLPPKLVRPVVGAKAGAFEVVRLMSGEHAVRSVDNGELMHPVGPWQEANRLYVEQVELEQKLRHRDDEPLRILDVGLGAGANAVAALSCAERPGRGRPLEIVSLEHDLDALRLALSSPEAFPYLQPWKAACEAILSDHTWESCDLTWRVLFGDARDTLEETDGVFDIVYFDPFSPEANPALWTVDFARRIRSKARYEGATLATYSAATPTRVMFLLAGFYVGHGVSSGTKSETTFASTQRELVPNPLGDRWLQRWLRSSTRGAHDIEFSPELERSIKEHPQFFRRKACEKALTVASQSGRGSNGNKINCLAAAPVAQSQTSAAKGRR